MATRFYLPYDLPTLPTVTIAASAVWDQVSGSAGGAEAQQFMSPTKQNSAFGTRALTDATATTDRDSMIRQYQYALPTGTSFATTDTVKGRVLCGETASGYNIHAQCVIRVVSSNGLTVRATLYGGSTLTGTSSPTGEWPVTGAGPDYTGKASRKVPHLCPVNLQANYTSVAGDILVAEIGYRKHIAGSALGVMRFGDNAASDLPEDETTTTDLNTWLEFSTELGGLSSSAPSQPIWMG